MGSIELRSRWAEVRPADGDSGWCDACCTPVAEGELILTKVNGNDQLWICFACVRSAYQLLVEGLAGEVNKLPLREIPDEAWRLLDDD